MSAVHSLSQAMQDMTSHMSAIPSSLAATKEKPTSQEIFSYIARALDRMRQATLSLPPESQGLVELEARLGILAKSSPSNNRGDERVFHSMEGVGAIELNESTKPSRFFPGVTCGAFEVMKQALTSMGSSVSHSHEVAYMYPGHMRIRCEGPVAKVGILERKKRLLDINVALPSAPYDLRLTLSVETEVGKQEQVQDGWESKRSKLRTTFKDPQGNANLGPWIVDMTTVTSDQGAGGEEQVSEVEMELDMGACREWIEAKTDAEADQCTSRFASRLVDTIRRLNPLEDSTAESFLKDVSRPQLTNAAMQRCGDVGGGNTRRFPGTMPVNLCRKDVGRVQQDDYWLAEKTDGVRYFFMVLPNGQGGRTALLVNRSNKVSSFPGSDAIGNGLPSGTVLDGELVFNRSTSTNIFLVFDVLFWGADCLMSRPYRDRLVAIHVSVIPTYETAIKNGMIPAANTLRLVGKKFYRRQDICRLFERVVEECGHRVYKDPSCMSEYLKYLGIDSSKPVTPMSTDACLARYCHKTDGIVFQPNRFYQCSTDIHFFKWKWMDTVTIDFSMHLNQDQSVTVKCQGQGQGLDLSKHITLEAPDIMRLRADMAAVPTCRIAELGFSPETGFWTYKKLRTDKESANYFTTVCTTMLELAEAIEEEELQYRMMVDHPARDDWVKQRGAMMKAALGWKRGVVEDDNEMQT